MDGPGGSAVSFTLFLTDNGPDGATDTFAYDGPNGQGMGGPPDCDATSPTQKTLWYGQVTILDQPSESGQVSGSGTSDLGYGSTRTFAFDATRDAAGAVTGTFSVSEGAGFALSGTVDCLEIHGHQAMLIGHGTPSMGGGGGTRYATFFVEDWGTSGIGDRMSANEYAGIESFGCLAAQQTPGTPLLSGDIAVTGPGSGPTTATPAHPVIASVSSPNGGPVTVTESTPGPPPPGYTLVGKQLHIVAPAADAATPLHLVFTVDAATLASATPALTASTVVVFRDGVAVDDCTSDTGDDPASPDPCVSDRTTLSGGGDAGDARITVLTSHASDWTVGSEETGISPLAIDTSPAAPATVAKLAIYEKTFQLSRTYGSSDVNDPAKIAVIGTFVAPSGAHVVVPAWYGKDYQVQAGTGVGSFEAYLERSPDAVWHVRFSPDQVGTWTYKLTAHDLISGQEATVDSATLTFDATASSAHGQVGRDGRDSRFLRYADGTPYLPMGENVGFQQGEPAGNDGEHYVEPLFASMQAAGQNWTRIWMTDFNRNALEWSSTHWAGWYNGVGQYAGQSAFRIERQLDVAAQHGLQVQLVIDDHGQVRSQSDGRWSENPYSDANGGPVPAAHPEQFFTNTEAKRLFKERLRYLVARYGAYRNLLAWELFNEVQFVGSDSANPGNSAQVRGDIVAWHAEMAAYLRSIDPFHHLITTSSDIDSSLKDIWADPNIDLVQVHDYDPALTTRDTRLAGYADSLNATYNKPVIIAEFGIAGDKEVNFDPVASAPLDANEEHLLEATHLHNAEWAAAMSGSGAMSWWWGAYIAASPSYHRTSPEFPANERINPPIRDFFAGEDLAGMSLHRSSITAPSERRRARDERAVEGLRLDPRRRQRVRHRFAAGRSCRPHHARGHRRVRPR